MKNSIEVYAIGRINYYEGHELSISDVAEEIDMKTVDLISALENDDEIIENKVVEYFESFAKGKDPECENYSWDLNADEKDGSMHFNLVSDFVIDRYITITKEMTAEEFINSINEHDEDNASIGYVDIRTEKDYSELENSAFYDKNEKKFILGDMSEILDNFEDFKKELFCFKEKDLSELTSFAVIEPEFESESSKAAVSYAIEGEDTDLFFERLGLGGDKYSTLSEVKEDYPDAYCNLYVTVFEDKQFLLTMTLVEGWLENGKEPDKELYSTEMTENEVNKVLELIEKDLERTGESLDSHLKQSQKYMNEIKNNKDEYELS